MWNSFSKIMATPSLRVAAITLFCYGFAAASTIPYNSLIGITQLGLSQPHYAMLMAAMAVTGMMGTLVLGYISDQARNRKLFILVTLAIGVIGFATFSIFPDQWSFIFCLVFVMPISGSTFSQIFAVVRQTANDIAAKDGGSVEAASINSVVRSVYAASWIIVPGAVGLFIATRKNVSDSFAIAAGAFALSFVIYALFGARSPNDTLRQNSAWTGIKAAFGLVANKTILYRIVALAFVATTHPSNAALLPLFVTRLPGGTPADVGLIAGLVAGLEIPFMLLGGYLNGRIATWKIIAGAGLTHATYLFCLSLVSATWQIYALTLLNAAGAAILLSLPLSYLQDLMPDRPGLGTSLLSISTVLQKAFAAVVFASAGTALGFKGAAMFGAALGVAGCCGLYFLERNQR